MVLLLLRFALAIIGFLFSEIRLYSMFVLADLILIGLLTVRSIPKNRPRAVDMVRYGFIWFPRRPIEIIRYVRKSHSLRCHSPKFNAEVAIFFLRSPSP